MTATPEAVVTDGSGNDEIRGIVIQSDGKIVAVGSATIDSALALAVARYDSV